MYGCHGGRAGGRIVGEFGVDMCTLPNLKWIIKKDLLCSTWNAAQCYMAAWMGGEFGRRMDTCICMAELLCYAPETITTVNQLYSNIKQKAKKKKKGKKIESIWMPPSSLGHEPSVSEPGAKSGLRNFPCYFRLRSNTATAKSLQSCPTL